MALQPGDILYQRYRIEQVIAIGGMGAVYSALDTVLNIQIAVKENTQTGEQFVRQFRREAALLSQLNHPNLPRVTDHFTIPGSGQYLVMDFIEGSDLRERLSQHYIFSENEVIAIGSAVCGALSYLHSRQPPVVHRDIKPGNIKITASGQVFLVDFGLAKLSHAGQSTTVGAQALTPGYASPEQYGQGTEPRSDIYSLGATLYAILTGKIPQDGLDRAMGNVVLTPIRQSNPSLTVQTASIIEKAMNVRPEDRYQTAADFCAALTASASSDPPDNMPVIALHDAPVSQPTVTRQAVSPNLLPVIVPLPPSGENLTPEPTLKSSLRPLVWNLSLVLILLVAGGVLLLSKVVKFPGTQPIPTQALLLPSTKTPASAALPSITPLPKTFTPEPGPTNKPSPTQELASTPVPTFTPTLLSTPLGGGTGEIAFSSNRAGTTQVWLLHSDGETLSQITNLPEGACQPDWSPDGKRLVFVAPCPGRLDSYPGSSLFIINANGTGLIPLASLPGGDFDPAWSPDGKTIAFTSLRGGKNGIYLYNLANNSVKRVSSPVNLERRPAWSPDGQTIAYETRRQGKPQIWVMAADGTNMREFSNLDSANSTMPAWAPQNPNGREAGLLIYSQGNEMPFLVGRRYGDPSSTEMRLIEKMIGNLEARFAPDGSWLAFTQLITNGATSVYRILNNGENPCLIPGSLGGDFHPAWRP